MRVVAHAVLPEVLVLQPDVHCDHRGCFFEAYSRGRYAACGLPGDFAQDNVSVSARGVLRGLHAQRAPHEQGKLVHCLAGEVFDVVVDIRPTSPTFGRWVAEQLSSTTRRQLWIPAGFAHGFLVLSELAVVGYKCTTYHEAAAEFCLLWSDPDLGIPWPVEGTPVLSARDEAGVRLRDL